MKILLYPLLFLLIAIPMSSLEGQQANYDEAKVPAFDLPSLLQTEKGGSITNQEDWINQRRPEILAFFRDQVYGGVPAHELEVSFKVGNVDENALSGLAVRKEIIIEFAGSGKTHRASLLLYTPKGSGPVPVFLGYNFYGNHTIIADPQITLHQSWVRDNATFGIDGNRASELSRGVRSGRWPVLYLLSRGYGIANIYYGDVDPDFDDGFQNGIHGLLPAKPKANEWGSIATWAWGLSRALDYFETDAAVDAGKVIVIGHSRLGKTSLWAGAADERFAMVISNNSGCGGAALSKRRFGETVARINSNFPHWFCDNFRQYNDREQDLPMDQHMLLALIAPRPLYVASASEDQWADPRGEFLASKAAGSVYELFGKKGLTVGEMPSANHPEAKGHIGYHLRKGSHDLTYYDWLQYLDFADRHLSSK